MLSYLNVFCCSDTKPWLNIHETMLIEFSMVKKRWTYHNTPLFRLLSNKTEGQQILHTPTYPNDEDFQTRSRSISEPNVTYSVHNEVRVLVLSLIV